MSRFFAVVAALLLSAAGPIATFAQEATPTSATFADTLDLPELEITQTEDGFAGVPEETEAGRYLVTFTGQAPQGIVNFVQLPEGLTVDDLLSAIGPVSADGELAGTPPAEEEAAPVVPEWLYETYVPGGAAFFVPGQRVQTVVDLRPGDYAVWNDDFEAPQAVPMTVTGEMPSDLPEPEADATIRELKTEEGYAFEVDGELAAGQLTLEIANEADQPHHVVFVKSPTEITEEQAMQLLMFDPSAGTPPPGLPSPEEFTFPAYVPTQSADTTQWNALNLEPGDRKSVV